MSSQQLEGGSKVKQGSTSSQQEQRESKPAGDIHVHNTDSLSGEADGRDVLLDGTKAAAVEKVGSDECQKLSPMMTHKEREATGKHLESEQNGSWIDNLCGAYYRQSRILIMLSI